MIELLVVIAIIALLASLLLPALTRAKSAAHSAKCRNNLRQISLALTLYVQDFSAYPFYQSPSSDYTSGNWYVALGEYLPPRWGTTGPSKVWSCPAAKPSHQRMSYGYNWVGFDNGEGLGLGGIGPHSMTLLLQPTPESMVRSPSAMMAIADGYSDGFLEKSKTLLETQYLHRMQLRSDTNHLGTAWRRHGGRLNAAFCDGHVESSKVETLFHDVS